LLQASALADISFKGTSIVFRRSSPGRRAAQIFDWKSSYLTHSPITSRARARLRSMGSVLLSPMFFRQVSSRGLFLTRKRIPIWTGPNRAIYEPRVLLSWLVLLSI